ncbi:type IV secretion system protein [Chelativorans sp. J32]|uniref:type IV secretion system protein n=1 Tax=Chelativorans sp. J32 TaxID=935840 RepID=UPI0004BA40A9|nr:type IV secretion system protein [Chelativorans sp. J32]
MAAGNFSIVEPLFNKIDTLTQSFVTDISSRAIAEITPVASVGLTLGFIAYGLLIIRGAVDMPVADFLARCLRTGIIVSIAMAGGLYQTSIADAIMATPDALARAIAGGATGGASAANIIDQAAQQGASYVSQAWEQAGLLSKDGLTYAFIGAIGALATAAVVGVGAVFVTVAKVALAILAGLGPIFIVALLFQSTARFFEQWAAQVLNYALTIVLFSVVFTLLMEIFGGYMVDAKFDGAQNVGYTLIGMLVISIVSVGLLLQLPSIASGLAGGIGISYWYELRAIRGGVGGAYRGGRAAARGAVAAPRAARNVVSGAANMATNAALGTAGAARAAAGYFRGRKAG